MYNETIVKVREYQTKNIPFRWRIERGNFVQSNEYQPASPNDAVIENNEFIPITAKFEVAKRKQL